MTLTVDLHERIADQLKIEAERQTTSVNSLVNTWLEEHLWHIKREQIQAEAQRFQAQHSELLQKYVGDYIAMQNGVVLDYDESLPRLHNRIREQYGEATILMTQVTSEPVPTIQVRGTRHRGLI